ncbi:hypothetical protein [Salegentibacter mishustinae]|nr:hypothetical protein [Salegentibacter mishustinae]
MNSVYRLEQHEIGEDPDVKSGLVRSKIFTSAKGLMNIKVH